jgi:putative ABC transport system substrate-binding protein
MDRRIFISAAAGGLLLDTIAVHGQPARKLRIIGVLNADPTPVNEFWAYFASVLGGLGWIEGTNFVFERRSADNHLERLPALAAELVRLDCDLIIGLGTQAPLALKQATTVIPILVWNAGDPVALGLVPNLARPGGNITGMSLVSTELAAKRLQLLKEIRPELSRVAFLFDPTNPNNVLLFRESAAAGRTMALEVQSVEVRRLADFDGAFQALTRQHPGGLIIADSALALQKRGEIAGFASANRLPALYPYSEYVQSGGLISYGPNVRDMIRRAAGYVDKILRGAKPGDLPIAQPNQYEMVINLNTAKALGITIPQPLLLRADEVIQ